MRGAIDELEVRRPPSGAESGRPRRVAGRAARNRGKARLRVLAALFCFAAGVQAQGMRQVPVSGGSVRIGVLTDLAGPYSGNAGEGSVRAARLAVEDFGGKVLGRPVEVLAADHQNKPDLGAGKAREWIDRDGVDVILDLVNGAVALAVIRVVQEKHRIALVTGTALDRITNEDCGPNHFQWGFDGFALARIAVAPIVRAGGRNWFFVTPDYPFGHSLQKAATERIEASGGRVAGAAVYPFPGSDFGPQVLKAQSAGADVIALANAGTDAQNTLRAARELGGPLPLKRVAFVMPIDDIDGIGLKLAQGMYVAEAFYWDQDEATRAFARRYFDMMKRMPTVAHAAAYSAVLHYLRSVQAAGTDASEPVLARMRAAPVRDFYAKEGRLRADGMLLHDMLLLQVKAPEESRYPWDYLRVVDRVKAGDAFRAPAESRCPLLRR